MKSKAILIALALSATMLVGCGGSTEKETTTDKPAQEQQENKEEAKNEGFTGTKTKESLYDPAGEKKDMVITSVTFENGKPVDVKIDVKTEDGKSKVEESEAGNYVMKDGEAKHWHEQIALLETFLKENNFDTSKVNLTDDAGHTDAVSGVTIKVPAYLTAVDEIIAEVANGKEEATDAVSTASLPTNLADFEKGVSAEGRWIITPVSDITSDKEVVIEGEFFKKDEKEQGLYRKLGLYAQDADRNVTAEYTLTAPKVTVKSENTIFQNGTIKGDVYVEANGFVLKGAKIEGNLYFASEDVKATANIEEGTVSGETAVK